VSGGRVSFVPPPPIDPSRKPRPGGAAALDIGNLDSMLACLDDDAIAEFFADDERAVRRWERGYSLAEAGAHGLRRQA
jgi:hypothetical protein